MSLDQSSDCHSRCPRINLQPANDLSRAPQRGIKATLSADERGQIAVMLVLLLPILLALAGLVVDGGIVFVNYRLGRVTVDSAALAAATKLDERVFRDVENAVVLDTEEAYQAALDYAEWNGRGRVAITGVSIFGNRVSVYGSVAAPTMFMRVLGVNDVVFNLSAEAELKYGITEEGQ
jgi:Flp pilus assembly protein TadG